MESTNKYKYQQLILKTHVEHMAVKQLGKLGWVRGRAVRVSDYGFEC